MYPLLNVLKNHTPICYTKNCISNYIKRFLKFKNKNYMNTFLFYHLVTSITNAKLYSKDVTEQHVCIFHKTYNLILLQFIINV